jgi:acetyl esterase/lipase
LLKPANYYGSRRGWAAILCLAIGVCGPFGALASDLVIPLYPESTPAQDGAPKEVRETLMGEARIRNVTRPTLTAYLPQPSKATGAAVIVAPGGAFMMLSIESEGEQVAEWLADQGVAAFVLKYRLNATPADSAAFQTQLLKMLQSLPSGASVMSILQTPGAQQAMADGLAAIAKIRERASEFGIDRDRIGILGFSAGAMLAMHAATHYAADSRADFVGSIYGALAPGQAIPPDAPPLFLAVAADDPLLAWASAPIFAAWQAAGRAAELHVYQKGSHGFGMKHGGHTSDHWNEEFLWWMQSQGWLKERQ